MLQYLGAALPVMIGDLLQPSSISWHEPNANDATDFLISIMYIMASPNLKRLQNLGLQEQLPDCSPPFQSDFCNGALS